MKITLITDSFNKLRDAKNPSFLAYFLKAIEYIYCLHLQASKLGGD